MPNTEADPVHWKGDAGNGATADLLATAKHVYYPRADSLVILDRATGRRRAALPQPRVLEVERLIASPVAAAGGQLFVTVNGAAWSFDEP